MARHPAAQAPLLHLPGAASFQPSTTDELVAAKNAWLDDASAATAMYGHISTWDTSLITDMDTIFCANEGWANMPGDGWLTRCDTRAATFDADISGWDMSSVTTMSYMFYQAAAFNQDLSAWDVSSVTTMEARHPSANASASPVPRRRRPRRASRPARCIARIAPPLPCG